MSQLGKILIWAAVPGAIVAAVFGWLVIQSRVTDAQNLHQAQAAKQSSDQAATAAKKAQEVAEQAKTEADNKLVQANSSVDDLKKQLADLQKQATDAATALASAQANAKDAQDALDKIKASLGNETVDQYIADKKKAEDDLAAAQAEQKIMQDQMQKLQQQVADAQTEINNSKIGKNAPGVSGKITFVDRTWNFVILDVGLSNGVVPNGELIVYRGRTFLGKVRITKADQNDSVAEILPDAKGSFQIGDAVLD